MKKILIFLTFIIAIPAFCYSSEPQTPKDLNLLQSDTEIKVSWTANTDETDGYSITYWKTEDKDNTKKEIKLTDKSYSSFLIQGLEKNTQYTVQIKTFSGNDESDEAKETIKTLEKFQIQPVTNLSADPTDSSIKLTWDTIKNDLNDEYLVSNGYYIYYYKKGESKDEDSRIQIHNLDINNYEIKGLESETEYTVEMSSYSNWYTGNAEKHESDPKTIKNIKTSGPSIRIEAIDKDEIKISVSAPGIKDYDSYSITITDQNNDEIIRTDYIQKQNAFISTDFEKGRYTVNAKLFDDKRNKIYEINKNFIFDYTDTPINKNKENIDSGCFITSASGNFNFIFPLFFLIALIAVPALKNKKNLKLFSLLVIFICFSSPDAYSFTRNYYTNNMGIKASLFLPSESGQKDVYDNIYIYSLFYEKMITRFFSADIEAGYSKTKGHFDKKSSSQVSIKLPKPELTMYPVSFSLNINMPFREYIHWYIGAGGDLWYIKEDSKFDDFSETISGWHAKAGLKIFSNKRETYKKVGMILESSYSQIDKFGKNDLDLGGYKFSIGFFYAK